MSAVIVWSICVAAVASAAGCSHQIETGAEGVSINSLVGQSLFDYSDKRASGQQINIVTVDPATSGSEKFDSSDANSPDWVIVAVCADASSTQRLHKAVIGVKPKMLVTASPSARSSSAYISKLNCEGLRYHS